jgi:riboflavin kinase/FMN adenylyltransferase
METRRVFSVIQEHAMQVFASLDEVALSQPQAISVGVFDGVHRGHQFVLARTAEVAARLGAQVTVVTFWPPPVAVLRPQTPIHCLSLPDEKADLLADLGIVAHTIILPFTPEMAEWAPETFMAALAAHMPLVAMVEGDDFSLGHNRAGTLDWLSGYGQTHGIQVEGVARRAEGGTPISSTRIRAALAEGNVAEAAELLGQPYRLHGTVVHGEARGRELGYPTANLSLDPLKFIPANGIYAVRAWDVATPEAVWNGAASIGTRPTFGGTDRRVEVYMLDASPDLYGTTLAVDFIAWLRDERAFSSREALIAQMADDVRAARRILHGPETGAR